MKRKIVLMLLAIIVLSMPFQSTYHQVDAAVATKAATLTAKKVAKEIIQDAAAQKAANMAVQQATDIIMGYQAKPGYKVICPTGVSACTNPVQIKETLTETDKANIKAQAGTELDKLSSPDGKGYSKWMKFMDWFIPIWLVTVAFTAITYALDPDVKSLFDEAAYNTLVTLGIIAPVLNSNESNDIGEVDAPSAVGKPNGDLTGEDNNIIGVTKNIGMSPNTYITNTLTAPEGDKSLHLQHSNWSMQGNIERIENDLYSSNYFVINTKTEVYYEVPSQNINGNETSEMSVSLNGETIYSGLRGKLTNGNTFLNAYRYEFGSESTSLISVPLKQANAIRTRMPYKIGEYWYTDVLVYTTAGDLIQFQQKSAGVQETLTNNTAKTTVKTNMQQTGALRVTIYTDKEWKKEIMPPQFSQIEQEGYSPISESSYTDENGNIAVLPPAAFTYIEESTGEQVERVKAPTGDGYVWQKPDGTQVPEEEIIPNPTEEPKITPSPDGTPQYTPAPTPSNPAPEPIPLQPNPTAPPAEPPPEDPPLSEFPEGEKCLAKLQFPIFSPLKEQLSTSFPFSIPWDIERAAQAAFGGISNEKPSFVMPIVMFGETHEINITTPKFMDDWKPFTDSLLLITFDILIMFGLYRFVKGAGS